MVSKNYKNVLIISTLLALSISHTTCSFLKGDLVDVGSPPTTTTDGTSNNVISLSSTVANSSTTNGDANTVASTASNATNIKVKIDNSPNAQANVSNSSIGNLLTFKGWAAKKFFKQN